MGYINYVPKSSIAFFLKKTKISQRKSHVSDLVNVLNELGRSAGKQYCGSLPRARSHGTKSARIERQKGWELYQLSHQPSAIWGRSILSLNIYSPICTRIWLDYIHMHWTMHVRSGAKCSFKTFMWSNNLGVSLYFLHTRNRGDLPYALVYQVHPWDILIKLYNE